MVRPCCCLPARATIGRLAILLADMLDQHKMSSWHRLDCCRCFMLMLSSIV